MQSVRRARTKPEETLALLLEQKGVDYAQNVEALPGKPDFVLDEADLVVFVHGCFWHGHEHCHKGRSRPKSNRRYWQEKIDRNRRRDHRMARQLRRLEYSVFVIWECELRHNRMPARLARRLGLANSEWS
jgi:DNA mismatch endonuclease (patch repair protein)